MNDESSWACQIAPPCQGAGDEHEHIPGKRAAWRGMRSGEDVLHAVDLDGPSLVFVRWFGRSFEASPWL